MNFLEFLAVLTAKNLKVKNLKVAGNVTVWHSKASFYVSTMFSLKVKWSKFTLFTLNLQHCMYSNKGCKAFFNNSKFDRTFSHILIMMIDNKSLFTQRRFAYSVLMRF